MLIVIMYVYITSGTWGYAGPITTLRHAKNLKVEMSREDTVTEECEMSLNKEILPG